MKNLPKGPLVLLGLAVYAALLFRVVWPAGTVIQSIDYNYGLMAMYKAELPGAFFEGFWRGFPLLGRVGSTPPTLTNLLLLLLPVEPYMDWIYPILLLTASAFFMAFLRLRHLGWIPCLFGTLTAFWIGSNLTLIYPGHLLKYGVLACAAATLFCLEKLHQTRSWRWAVLTGGSLGWMFMHQADVALFFGLVLGAYHLFRSSEEWKTRLPPARAVARRRPGSLGSNSALLLAVAGLFVWESYHTQMDTQVRNVDVLQEGNEEARWDFATQWSFPPAEGLDLIAPGYWGWTSQHETAPYHGVTGQSAEWRAVQQGFPNLRMESVYLGVIPLGLAVLALFSGPHLRRETVFWSVALILTLWLSFGKFTPLYRLLFELPLVNAIRNPNKFLQVFQLAAGILAAIGLHGLLTHDSKKIRIGGAAAFLGVSLMLGAGSLLTDPNVPAEETVFADTLWASRARPILQNRQIALLHGSLFAGAGAIGLYLLKKPKLRPCVGAGLVLTIMADGALLGRQYLKPAPVEFLQENALTDFLKQNLGTERVAVLQSDGISTFYLTHLFPAHHIAFADIAAAPRLQQEYQTYFDAIGTQRLRMWQEFGVKYVLSSRSFLRELYQQMPALRRVFREAWSYTLAQSAPGQLDIHTDSSGKQGNLVVLEFRPPSNRFHLISRAQPGSVEEVVRAIEAQEPPLAAVRIQDPDFEGFSFTDPAGEVTGILPTQSGFLLQVRVDTPKAILRLADRFDPALRARINGGDPIPLLQTDLLFAGLELPQGVHEIELLADLPAGGRIAQGVGLLLCLGVALSMVKRKEAG